jgi:hypothetical protein
MKTLDGMVAMVQNLLNWNGIGSEDIIGRYVNNNRNYVITDKKNHKTYFLKWDTSEWLAAGYEVPGIGKGPGRAVDLDMFMNIIRQTKATTLFGLSSSDMIQYIEYDEFDRLGEPHQQRYNQQWVRVVSCKSLKSWGGLRPGI